MTNCAPAALPAPAPHPYDVHDQAPDVPVSPRRAMFAPADDVDPFGLERLVLGTREVHGAHLVASLETMETAIDPSMPVRMLCRRADGSLILAEGAGSEIVQLGQPVTFGEAGELARSILAGGVTAQRALTSPGATRLLAIAYLAARVAADQPRLPAAHRGA